MKFNKEEVYNALDILTCQIQESDELGWCCKQELKNVLDDYFNRIESKKVVIDPKYESYRCPKCNTTLIGQYDHYCRQCGQKLDWRINDKS